ncbi:HD domain-containing protein [Candidatus Dojkabacteria bacterium]|uniref:HD domain-containing protein n=1 Tax=Candidatus Dojkabacteria bacterium TaxID=2099670 RepID=A0A955L9Y2_9BACT|nr:HD domain-containing protein [Candidatus Dojkabacteria bacterium]
MDYHNILFEKIKSRVKNVLGTTSADHDYHHALRVFNLANTLQKTEGGDMIIIGCAALAHDYCRPWEKETGKPHFGDEALKIIDKEVLKDLDLTSIQIGQILEVIAKHDIYDWSEKDTSKSLELKIVQDADNLDAIGAIGIARLFSFVGAYNTSMWEPGEDLTFNEDFTHEKKHTSGIAHLYDKLFKLQDNMNTAAATELAQHRHLIMEQFVEEFMNEWTGKK